MNLLPLAMETTESAGAAGFGTRLEAIDVVVMVAYIVGIVGLGCWVGLRHRQKGGEANARGAASVACGMRQMAMGMSVTMDMVMCMVMCVMSVVSMPVGGSRRCVSLIVRHEP